MVEVATKNLSADPELDSTVSRRLLLVDDSKLQRKVLNEILSGWGFDVAEAESADEALKLCKEKPPDIVISDWIMPGMSGLQFCEAFREISQDHYGYFILLTAKKDKAEVAVGLDAGADDFLSKPVDTNELRARITAGERIVKMQRELSENNVIIQQTLDELQHVYGLLNKDLLEAKKLQHSLIPKRHRAFPEGTLTLMLRSAGHVGGDLVGFFLTDDSKVGLFGIDVSGHGISSALMTARLAGYLSAAAQDQNVALRRLPDGRYVARAPRDVVSALNTLVLTEMELEKYFTLILAFLDLQTGKVTVSQAGHPHPMVQRANGDIEKWGEGGFPTGLLPDVLFDDFEFQLNPGDRLILLSDGVIECPDAEGAIMGDETLASILRRLKQARGPAFFDGLIWEMAAFANADEFPDDVSGILFEYSGPVSS